MTLNLHYEAESAYESAQPATKSAARPMLELISAGFQITWFRETAPLLWLAVAKPSHAVSEHFGLRQECFVIGNGYPNDFHQRTLTQEPPDYLVDRLDPAVRFVASDAAIAEAFCAAWAQKNRSSVVVLHTIQSSGASDSDRLYSLLSTSLWRRDFFAEAEPVREPNEFFGRELVVNQLFTKIILGSPIALFGMRKIGKSSLLGRLEDLTEQDESAVTATAFLIGNSTRLKSGRWWHVAQDMLDAWQTKLQRFATQHGSKVYAKAERLSELISKKATDQHTLATAFERDITALLKAARALKSETGRETVRLVFFLDECDHLYPHLPDAGHWRADFFSLWNELQAIKRRLESPDELVYVLGGVNPSGVEQGALVDQPNPLYELQRIYLGPMPKPEADSLLVGLGSRMGLLFSPEALECTYELVGGHPLLLRKLGSAVHETTLNRSERKLITKQDVDIAFNRRKRDLYNQVTWFLEHLSKVAPDEERLLRDIARGGAQAYAELWGNNDFRETYAYHLERYGLVRFENDLPVVSLSLIKEALQKPVVSEYEEQKKQLKDAVEAIEQAVRIRLRVDVEHGSSPEDAVNRVVYAIPSDAKNRALPRQKLIDLGAIAGVGAVLESLNWGDYEILLEKFHDDIEWVGPAMTKQVRIALIKTAFTDAHLVRHNNDHMLKEMIDTQGYRELYDRFAVAREMLSA